MESTTPPIEKRSASNYVKWFHQTYPNATSVTFGWGRLADGSNSYDVLIDAWRSASATTVLDLACGAGYLYQRARDRSCTPASYIGVDFSCRELQASLNSTRATQLIVGDAHQLPIREDCIDFIASHMALMLFENVETVLHEVRRVLMPGGTFAAILPVAGDQPDARFQWFRSALATAISADDNPFRQLNAGALDDTALSQMLAAIGFQTVTITPIDVSFGRERDPIWTLLTQTYLWPLLTDAAKSQVKQQFRHYWISEQTPRPAEPLILRLRLLKATYYP